MNPINSRFTEADRLYSNAVSLLASGDVAGAAGLLLEITQRFNTYGKAWCEMADILQYHLKDLETAAEYYRKAIEVTPLYTPSYLGYADVLFAQEKFAEVNAIINQVLEIPGVRKDLALQKSGILMESQGRYDEAIESYKQAILISFSEEEILKCENGIKRCNIKKKYT